jgi:hypothetical protein
MARIPLAGAAPIRYLNLRSRYLCCIVQVRPPCPGSAGPFHFAAARYGAEASSGPPFSLGDPPQKCRLTRTNLAAEPEHRQALIERNFAGQVIDFRSPTRIVAKHKFGDRRGTAQKIGG